MSTVKMEEQILKFPHTQKILNQTFENLEEKYTSSLKSLLQACKFDEEIGLHELGISKTLILVTIDALAKGDLLVLAGACELAKDLAPLQSNHLVQWLQEDYKIPEATAKKAIDYADSIKRIGFINIPEPLLKIVYSLRKDGPTAAGVQTKTEGGAAGN
uniref:Unkown protein n=1 Tax=Riptortus pedestris TaxID=329032 RepID=R4WNI4_RIPPE|nr:unkown protein [Riptortus pedestris]